MRGRGRGRKGKGKGIGKGKGKGNGDGLDHPDADHEDLLNGDMSPPLDSTFAPAVLNAMRHGLGHCPLTPCSLYTAR